MLILVTGASGQLGKSIKKLIKNTKIKHDFVFATRNHLDLSYLEDIKSYFKDSKFDLIINCAAYTKVDKAELDQKQANLINHLAVKKLAEIAKSNNIKLIHISTDFVFNGLKNKLYFESDNTSPLNVYGETKLAGERAILSIMKINAIIIRTSWVYSEYGNNFVDTIMRLIQKGNDLNIVSDQIGTPTYAGDLGQVILNIIKSDKFNLSDQASEIYHYSNEGECSWYDFAKEIANIAEIKCSINPINTKNYPTDAKRPKHVLLSKEKIIKEFDLKINYWADSLRNCMKNLPTASSLNKD